MEIENYIDSVNKMIVKFNMILLDTNDLDELGYIDTCSLKDNFIWPVNVSDSYFSLDEVYITVKYNISSKIVWKRNEEYCWMSADDYYKNHEHINLYNYWRMATLSPEMLEKERQEDLARCKDNVDKARWYFEEAIRNKISSKEYSGAKKHRIKKPSLK